MKKVISKYHITQLPKCAIYAAIGIIGIPGITTTGNASALSYSDNVGINFTFDQSLTVSLSSADIVINNLAPGSASDSNVIDVNVLSNNLSGYTLTSTVGNGNNYNDANLTHTNNSSNTFTGLSTSESISSLDDFDDNTWGYSYSLDNGNTWINAHETIAGVKDLGYSGLPLYNTTGATLKTSTTSSAEGGDTIKFKIAAKASTSQPSGEYRNVINFTVTAEHNPVSFYDAFKEAATKDLTITTLNGYYKMQDMTADICNTIEAEESQMTLIDTRDHNVYTVAKLKDNRCWMTQNLDLNLSTTTALTSNDTDLTAYGSGAYTTANGYSQSGSTIIWTPKNSTINYRSDASTKLGTTTGWESQNSIPFSVDMGDWYWSGNYYNSNNCYVNSNDQTCNYATKPSSTYSTYFSTTPYALNGTHGHVGNYYNWTAAIATNDSSSYTSDTMGDTSANPANSICPAGWRLPKIANYTAGQVGNNELYNLDYYYNGGVTNTDAGLIAPPLFLTRAGLVWGSALHHAGNIGYYWSSTVTSAAQARGLNFSSDWVNPAYSNNRSDGRSLRCLAR